MPGRRPGTWRPRAQFALLLSALVVMPRTTSARGPGIQIRVVASETLSLLYFAEAIIGTPSRSAHLKELYLRHREATHLSAEEEIRSALRSTPQGFPFFNQEERLPEGRNHWQSVLNILELAASRSRGVADLEQRTMGLLPVASHARFIRGLKGLQGLHRRVVWRPGRGFLELATRRLQGLFKRVEAPRLLQRIATFYGSAWPQGLPITVALVPIPGRAYKSSHTYAHSTGALEVVEVLERDDLENRLGVLIHEICHSLYDVQPLELQRRLESWFSGPGFAPLAYDQINEALATAIGNGQVHGLLKPEASRRSWYADRVINDFAKAIYPSVRSYLDGARTLDRGFVEGAVRTFAKVFPDARSSPRFSLSRIYLFVDGGLDGKEIYKAMGREVRISSSHRSSPLDHPKTLANFQRSGKRTVVFFLGEGGVPKLKLYSLGKRILSVLARAFRGGVPFVYATRLGQRTAFFIGAPDKKSSAQVAGRFARLSKLVYDKVTPLEQ